MNQTDTALPSHGWALMWSQPYYPIRADFGPAGWAVEDPHYPGQYGRGGTLREAVVDLFDTAIPQPVLDFVTRHEALEN